MRTRSVCLMAVAGLGVLYVAAGLRETQLYAATPPDTVYYNVIARNLARGDGFVVDFVSYHPAEFPGIRQVPEMHGFLRPLALAPLYAWRGEDRPFSQIPGLLYVALTGVAAFLLAERLHGAPLALIPVVLVLSHKGFFWWADSGTDDVGFAFWFTLMIWLLLVALQGERDRFFLLAGISAALATLEKPIGFFLPALLMVLIPRLPRWGWATTLRRTAAFALPWALAVSVYFLRNYLAYGSLGFRFATLHWLHRLRGIEAPFAVYDSLPSLADLVAEHGFEPLLAGAARSFGKLLADLVPTAMPALGPTVPLLALLALPLAFLRRRDFALLFTSSFLGASAFVCVLYHFESRFFLMFAPLFAVLVLELGRAGEGSASRLLRVLRWAGRALLIALCLRSALLFAVYLPNVSNRTGPDRCPTATTWIARFVPPADVFLDMQPWHLTWATGHRSVMFPSGGPQAVEAIARRYDAHWMLVRKGDFLRPRTYRVASTFAAQDHGLRVSEAFSAGGCRVLRLDW